MADWDDEDFEPKDLAGDGMSNKWEGEDEDDEVKENWEDEEEEKKAAAAAAAGADESAEAKPKPKKKLLQEKIAERERQKKEEHEKRAKEQPEEEISPEEQLRRQKESDLKVALETTFGGNNKCSGVDGAQPTNKEEFQELADTLTKNVQQFAKSEEYPVFAENLIRGVCATLNSFDLKKIKTTIDNMYLEKQKIEKGDKTKRSKGKGKAKLKMEGDNQQLNQYSAYVDDYEFDDFM